MTTPLAEKLAERFQCQLKRASGRDCNQQAEHQGEDVIRCCNCALRPRILAFVERVRRETIEAAAELAIDIQPGVIGGTGQVNRGIRNRILRLKAKP